MVRIRSYDLLKNTDCNGVTLLRQLVTGGSNYPLGYLTLPTQEGRSNRWCPRLGAMYAVLEFHHRKMSHFKERVRLPG